MIERTRRSLLNALNSRWIYGTVPLLHAIIFLCEMAAVSLLVQKFNTQYARRPILTTMMTNAILGGIADTTAQIITSVRQRANRHGAKRLGEDVELEEKHPWPPGGMVPNIAKPPPAFDFERLTRFMAYGFIMAPVQFKWFGFLSSVFPLTKTAGTLPALKRVAFDQLIFSPIGIGAFFAFMTIAEGGGRRALIRKFADVYVPTLKANYILWPAVQIVNFRFMPLQFQIPFVSTIGITWTAYLSLSNSADEAE